MTRRRFDARTDFKPVSRTRQIGGKGTLNRRIVATLDRDDFQYELHATKGVRRRALSNHALVRFAEAPR
jgi:hypothetical protein